MKTALPSLAMDHGDAAEGQDQNDPAGSSCERMAGTALLNIPKPEPKKLKKNKRVEKRKQPANQSDGERLYKPHWQPHNNK